MYGAPQDRPAPQYGASQNNCPENSGRNLRGNYPNDVKVRWSQNNCPENSGRNLSFGVQGKFNISWKSQNNCPENSGRNITANSTQKAMLVSK